jgi:predicted nuclease of predicted toxin-antitoxin system
MSRVFAALYFDEDVDVLVAELVRARGFAATTTLDAARLHASDAEQIEYAAGHDLVLVTHNRGDFTTLHARYAAERRCHSGIVVAVRRPPHEIARRLLIILNRLTAGELENQLLFI